MSELPDTWLTCKLGDVVNYGATQKAEPTEIPDDAWVLELEDVEKDTSKILQRLTFKQRQSKSTKSRFETGDILYGKLRPYLNKVVRADHDGYCTTEIMPIKPSEIVEGAYLFHWLKTPTFIDYVTSVSHGLNMPRLGTEAGRQAPFLLAPLNEQKRIADKLDAVLARVDACLDHLDRIPAILKRFRQSVLAAATSGKLTEDWPGHVSFSGSTLGEIAKWSSGGTPSRSNPRYFGGEIPWVKTGELRENVITSTDETLTEDGLKSSSAKLFPRETILIAMYGATIGRVALLGIEAATNQACAAAVANPGVITPQYLFLLLQAEKANLVAKGQGGAQPNISQGLIKEHEVMLPEINEQDEIVRRVEALFVYADRLESRYTAVRAQIEKLTPSTLAKAFRGELVLQDPNDEPASVLLERIRATSLVKEKQTKIPRKAPMEKHNTDTVKAIIQQIPLYRFSFDELRNRVATDYETLKDIVFVLLSESEPLLRQVFDEKAHAMCLEKVVR